MGSEFLTTVVAVLAGVIATILVACWLIVMELLNTQTRIIELESQQDNLYQQVYEIRSNCHRCGIVKTREGIHEEKV